MVETAEIEDDGPECETCGKATCPDADLPGFSEPRDCAYAPIYHALKDAKDCDYGCARDYTNQAVRLWVVEAVEQIAAAQVRAAIGDLVPGLRAEAARLRVVHVPSVALWMETEADRLEHVLPPGQPAGGDLDV